MVLMLDPVSQRLYTVASRGYAASGVGSEIALGEGVVGVAARERTPVRIMHMTSAHLYSQAMRNSLPNGVPGLPAGTDIPYPGLAAPQSQLAVPIVSVGQLLGVLFVESPRELQFSFEDEDVLVALAGQLGAAIDLMQASTESVETTPAGAPFAERGGQTPPGPVMRVRHYRVNDSVFIDDTYLIKGVAGAILWKLLRDHHERGRQVFANRELRLDPALRLPDITDNLEARLLLLQRRLREQCPALSIEKTGRGRFRFDVLRPVELVDVAA
jgi:adenylate cyclase